MAGETGKKNFVERDNKMPVRVFVNDAIKARQVIVIDEEGVNLGTFGRDRALEMAEEQGVDLVQMSYNPVEQVSTAKLVDYGKYMYDKSKTDKEKNKQKRDVKKGFKEIKFGYNIGENDLALKVSKAREFFAQGYTVRFSVRLKGREKMFANHARDKMIQIQKDLASIIKTPAAPKDDVSGYSMTLYPS